MLDDPREGFRAFKVYLAVRAHFTSDYDYFKYNGGIRANEETYLKRKDRFFFKKLQRKISNRDELARFIAINFIENPKVWAKDLVSDKAEEIYQEFLRREGSRSYVFKNDCQTMADLCPDLNELLAVKTSELPTLIKLYLNKTIGLDTLLIIDRLTRFSEHWDKKIGGNFIWDDLHIKMKKSSSFFKIDDERTKKILVDAFSR